ncbi:MAG: hypothetical protein BMS9Abin28_2469 [Anaerolineae bacterium]|nr:MAG: hypothetical protein BMS9Abin28_2469 [Anaerolineae bacterium]
MEGVSRRDFLKISGLSLGGFAFLPPGPEAGPARLGVGRVTVDWIGLYSEPDFRSKQRDRVRRDSLISLLDRINADNGPQHNPLWYQVPHGFVHSGYIQRVDWDPQPALRTIPNSGALFEVSVPYTRSHRKPDPTSDPLYRFYYRSTAWVTNSTTGEDGRTWYEIFDDLVRINYWVRGEHLRWVPSEEIAPISPEVPLSHKRIEVRLSSQELFCYEHRKPVFRTRIASGIPDKRPRENGIPPITPSGRFWVEVKMPSRHMGNGQITADIHAYELLGVPWVSFFTVTGVAFHGTYWHTDFGRPQSSGCINMRLEEAKWLYRWTLPVVAPEETRRIARGTPILVA